MNLMLVSISSCTQSRGDAGPAKAVASRRRLLAITLTLPLALATVSVLGCKRFQRVDTRPLDQAGMWFRSVEELRGLKITDAEVPELVQVRQAGISDEGCIELVRIARGRKESFASGEAITGLRRAGVGESTVVELARLNQLGAWAVEARIVRLAGFSDQVLLSVARRRAAAQPVPSGASLARLKNSGLSEAQILTLVQRGVNDAQAEEIIAARRRAAGGTTFVRQPRHWRRR